MSSEGRVKPAKLLLAQHPGLQPVSQPPATASLTSVETENLLDLLYSAHFTRQPGQQVSQKSRLSPILPPSCLLMTPKLKDHQKSCSHFKAFPNYQSGRHRTRGNILAESSQTQPTLHKDQLLQRLNLSPAVKSCSADLQFPVMFNPNMPQVYFLNHFPKKCLFYLSLPQQNDFPFPREVCSEMGIGTCWKILLFTSTLTAVLGVQCPARGMGLLV